MVQKRFTQSVTQKPFWTGLTAVFLLSVLVVFLSVESPTANAVQKFAFVKAGTDLHFEIRDVEGLKEATVHITEDIKNALIHFDELDPATYLSEGRVYGAFRISSEQEKSFSSFNLILKLSGDKLRNTGLVPNEIKLYHQEKEFVLTPIESPERYYQYAVTITQMGDYVIGKKQKEIQKQEEPTEIVPKNLPEVREEQVIPTGSAIAPSEKPIEQQPKQQENGFWQKVKQFLRNFIGS